jgi:hypothetical protein
MCRCSGSNSQNSGGSSFWRSGVYFRCTARFRTNILHSSETLHARRDIRRCFLPGCILHLPVLRLRPLQETRGLQSVISFSSSFSSPLILNRNAVFTDFSGSFFSGFCKLYYDPVSFYIDKMQLVYYMNRPVPYMKL